jgi:hypothetical protein
MLKSGSKDWAPTRPAPNLWQNVHHMEDPSLPEILAAALIPKYRIIPLMFRQVKHAGRPEMMEVSLGPQSRIVRKTGWGRRRQKQKSGTTSARYSRTAGERGLN